MNYHMPINVIWITPVKIPARRTR